MGETVAGIYQPKEERATKKASLLTGFPLLMSMTVLTAAPLGVPPAPIPADNPQSPEKIQLVDKLYHDKRLSSTGEASCATCHDEAKAVTDNLPVSTGINDRTGTRNAPTVVNTAYMTTQFRDGREPDLGGRRVHAGRYGGLAAGRYVSGGAWSACFTVPRDMINWCIQNPQEVDHLHADEPRMIALQAYIAHECRGTKPEPGRH